ncbi:transporter substrate-binding domain-containing protein [Pseudomonas sp. UL073]|uniref:Transporter substrate-binding domain-containing protein n=1 Tax=Zestomonas insulae TaxID=2809017 RepID=A0ABS2IEC6_9GAMM|nr:transporter substrate-binding domain-containing protein [Pseudomonas insulae]MBM7061437.1 transporter substrate-binding domain-containing protein [Pseudomonas insulae]
MRTLKCLPLLLALAAGMTFAAPPVAPVVVGFYDFPPSIYTDADGKPQGPMVEMMRLLLERAGYPLELRSLPSARLYTGLQDGSVQIWAGPHKELLKAHVLTGQQQLSAINLNLYYRADMPRPQVPVDLIGRELVMISGYNYSASINQYLNDPGMGIGQHRTRSHDSALEMLLRRRGDYLLDYSIAVDDAAQSLGVAVPPHVELERLPLYLHVSRHQPHAAKLLHDLDAAYLALEREGVDLSMPGDPDYQRRGLAREVGSAISGSSGQ